jgi:hypothetical protein
VKNIVLSWRVALFGVFSWLIPFLASFPFFDQTGQLLVPQPLFKSLMVVVGSGVGVVLLAWAFRWVRPNLTSGLLLGVYWLVINLVLDVAVLVPMSGMEIGFYFYDIGLRYLVLPIVAAAMGAVAERRAEA